MTRYSLLTGAVIALLPYANGLQAQPTSGRGQQGPRVVSLEVLSDNKVTFRLLAPEAGAVVLNLPHPISLQSRTGCRSVWRPWIDTAKRD